MFSIDNILKILALLGIGGIIGTYIRILCERRNTALRQKQEFKETRYKCILLLLYSCLDFEKQKPMLHEHGRKFSSLDELIDELKTEWHNMLLYASDEVLISTHTFIEKPNQENFRTSVLAMRKDLWGGKLSPNIEKLSFS